MATGETYRKKSTGIEKVRPVRASGRGCAWEGKEAPWIEVEWGGVYNVCFITILSSVNRTAGNRKDKKCSPVVADSVQCGDGLCSVVACGF